MSQKMSQKSVAERYVVLFTGHVQGVGFRYTTREIASRFDVTGFVRNLNDGRVELVAEGAAKELRAMLEEIRSEMGQHIHDQAIQTLPANHEFTHFDIRY